MRSIWLCSRNDALGNAAVMTAAGGVFAVASGWPDIVVAALIAGVNTSAAAQVMRRAIAELRVAGGGISPEYRGVINPLVPTAKVIEEGGVLYQQRCAVCYGAQGMGDGEAARYLNPSPALLAYMVQMPMSVDEYLMWSIAEGGAAVRYRHARLQQHAVRQGDLENYCFHACRFSADCATLIGTHLKSDDFSCRGRFMFPCSQCTVQFFSR